MKKRIVILSVIFLGIIIVYNLCSNKIHNMTYEGVNLSVGVNGTKQNTFPSMGQYDVVVDCNGADGVWNYSSWQLEVSNITSTTAYCNIDFNSITSRQKLNSKIIGLSGTTQGDGRVVDEENSQVPNYNNATTLNQSDYKNLSIYNNDSLSANSGANASNSFKFANNKWESVTSGMRKDTNYIVKFTVPSNSYYQMCYSIASGPNNNYFVLFKNETREIFQVNASSSSVVSDCYNLGYLTTSDTIRFVQGTDPNFSSTTMYFYLKKSNSTTSYDTGYRYEGKNPNNYVLFNNELWRIIGVFDSNTHGKSGNLTKIIRNDSIGSYAWDGKYREKWTESTLYNLLNDYYYNAKNASGESSCKFMRGINARCDFSKIGLNSISRNLIQKVNWKVGANNNYYGTPASFYTSERLINDYNITDSNSVENNIGLMYPSDYGYSVLSNVCPRTTNMSDYAEKNCASNSWLTKYNFEWTLSMYTSPYNLRWGYITTDPSEFPFNVRPTVYLKSNVYVVSGDGSYNNPYVIGI